MMKADIYFALAIIGGIALWIWFDGTLPTLPASLFIGLALYCGVRVSKR